MSTSSEKGLSMEREFTAVADFATASSQISSRRRGRRSTPPFSLRLTPEERARLDDLAGSMPLGQYIRIQLLGPNAAVRKTRRRPSADAAKLALVLAELGKSRLATNINQLARAANMGELDIRPETEREILDACSEIRAMRTLLIAALGIKPEDC